MAEIISRFPGVQPFGDFEISHSTFFGREQETLLLKAQITGNRLTVVYAQSGVGKTSLLKAGLHPALRRDGFLPLMVRVNDGSRSVLHGVLESVSQRAIEQAFEYVPGDPKSLWHFFKTVEFWKGDFLQTPILILDQFEELFTLRTLDEQIDFLAELGNVVRGDIPSQDGNVHKEDLNPPALHVVISLREEYVGLLDEASDFMPMIFHNRFRLRPLELVAAREAVTRPTQLSNPVFRSQPFQLEQELTDHILDFLSEKRLTLINRSKYVDPYQLQIICESIERHVIKHQKNNPEYRLVSLNDLGGPDVLKKTISKFISNGISHCCDNLTAYRGLFRRSRMQVKVKTLCTKFLLNNEGKRLSIDAETIETKHGVPSQILLNLVNARLLRSEQRGDNLYYEISHDCLADLFREKLNLISTRRFFYTVLLRALIPSDILLVVVSSMMLTVVLFPEWGLKHLVLFINSHSPEVFKAQSRGFFIASVFTLSMCLLATQAANRRLSYLNRLRSDHDDPSLAPINIANSLGLFIDGTLITLGLFRDPRFIKLFLLLSPGLILSSVYIDYKEKSVFQYSSYYHPLPFFFSIVSYILISGSVMLLLGSQEDPDRRRQIRWKNLMEAWLASFRCFLLIWLWFVLGIYMIDMSNARYAFAGGGVQILLRILGMTSFLLGGAMLCTYIYLFPELVLEKVSLRQTYRRALQLASFNRWSTILAQICVGMFYCVLFFNSSATIEVLGKGSYPQSIIILFFYYSLTAVTVVAWTVMLYLGYSEAKDELYERASTSSTHANPSSLS